MRAELTQDRVGVDKSAGLHVLLGIAQGLVQRGAVFLVEPISRIERQELDFRSFRKIRGSSTTSRPAFTRAFNVMQSQ
jgi:hypothetical protein